MTLPSNYDLVNSNYVSTTNAIRASITKYLEHVGNNHVRDIEIEDWVSGSWAHIWRKIDSYDPSKGSFRTWACKIAFRLAADYARKLPKEFLMDDYQIFYDEGEDEEGKESAIENTADHTVSQADEILIGQETENKIRDILSVQSDTKQEIVNLTAIGFTPHEIAAELGLSVNSVRVRKAEVLKTLRNRLAA